MKRMYITLGVMLLLLTWAVSGLGQKANESKKSAFEARLEMHRRLMESMLSGMGNEEDLFKDMDTFINEALSDRMTGFDSIKTSSQNYQSEWLEDESGRTLVITPKNPQQELNIDVSDGLITIKGKTEQKSQAGTSVSTFSNTFNVPKDCDASQVRVEQKHGKILVSIPFEVTKARITPQKNKLRPLPPSKSDVAI